MRHSRQGVRGRLQAGLLLLGMLALAPAGRATPLHQAVRAHDAVTLSELLGTAGRDQLNATIAGGNLFILGQTFQNTANRLAGYAARNGKKRILTVYSDNLAGRLGKQAIEQAVQANGGSITVESQPDGGTMFQVYFPLIAAQPSGFGV